MKEKKREKKEKEGEKNGYETIVRNGSERKGNRKT